MKFVTKLSLIGLALTSIAHAKSETSLRDELQTRVAKQAIAVGLDKKIVEMKDQLLHKAGLKVVKWKRRNRTSTN